MSDTHFNALRMEADELEKDANVKLSQAKELRDKANVMDPNYKAPTKANNSDATGKTPQLAKSSKMSSSVKSEDTTDWDDKSEMEKDVAAQN